MLLVNHVVDLNLKDFGFYLASFLLWNLAQTANLKVSFENDSTLHWWGKLASP